ncbi:Amidinotransferase [Aphelenchoides besseyi]|nr:Amidinotransferase [Aphelenchoides besseyi]KAI6209863.1 Amidinotransferase [Aphelenchoides besseyi]
MTRAVSDVLRRVLMVPPKYFTVEYAINPWMGGTVDVEKCHKQWSNLKEAIEKQGVQVLTLEQQPDLPDQVFVCNSGLVFENKVYLSHFRHPERQGEQEHYLRWYRENGFEIMGADYVEYFEGGGDACFSDYKTLWAGYGVRSSKNVYDRISKMGTFEIVRCELVSNRFYHLDTCFTPVGNQSALWYPPAFSAATQKEIERRLPSAIAVSDGEAEAFVCNAITIRKSVISPLGVSDKTKEALKKLDYDTVEVNMSEFMKSGGACQCLVMKL